MATKRELDKESMFRKIMPSAGEPRKPVNNSAGAYAAAETEPVQTISAEPQPAPLEVNSFPAQDTVVIQQENPSANIAENQQTAPANVPAGSARAADAQSAAFSGDAQPDTPSITAEPAHPYTEQVAEQTGHDEEKPKPVNLAEILAEEYYSRYQQRLNGCSCQRCKDDVLGITLNKVKPRYVASDRLNPSELKNRALITETVTCLIQAIQIVKNNPHHNENDLIRQ